MTACITSSSVDWAALSTMRWYLVSLILLNHRGVKFMSLMLYVVVFVMSRSEDDFPGVTHITGSDIRADLPAPVPNTAKYICDMLSDFMLSRSSHVLNLLQLVLRTVCLMFFPLFHSQLDDLEQAIMKHITVKVTPRILLLARIDVKFLGCRSGLYVLCLIVSTMSPHIIRIVSNWAGSRTHKTAIY